jgi:hypothetical protein
LASKADAIRCCFLHSLLQYLSVLMSYVQVVLVLLVLGAQLPVLLDGQLAGLLDGQLAV